MKEKIPTIRNKKNNPIIKIIDKTKSKTIMTMDMVGTRKGTQMLSQTGTMNRSRDKVSIIMKTDSCGTT